MTETKGIIKNEGTAETPLPGTAAIKAGAEARDNKTMTKPFKIRKRIGSTVYEVDVSFSPSSRETIDDKILRLVRGGTAGGKDGVK